MQGTFCQGQVPLAKCLQGGFDVLFGRLHTAHTQKQIWYLKMKICYTIGSVHASCFEIYVSHLERHFGSSFPGLVRPNSCFSPRLFTTHLLQIGNFLVFPFWTSLRFEMSSNAIMSDTSQNKGCLLVVFNVGWGWVQQEASPNTRISSNISWYQMRWGWGPGQGILVFLSKWAFNSSNLVWMFFPMSKGSCR